MNGLWGARVIASHYEFTDSEMAWDFTNGTGE
jgi:hypothetical protein